MNPKLKALIFFIGAILFVIVGVVGVKFILQAQKSASGINTQIPTQKKSINIDNLSLSQNNPSPNVQTGSDVFSLNPALNSQPSSSGQDAQITSGEFAYRGGVPKIEILLQNQSDFPIQAAHVSLFLRLNGKPQNVAQEIAVPITLPQILPMGESVRVAIPATQAAWSAENVAQAQSRQLVAQVVSVTAADEDGSEYPQTSSPVALKQTANDWTLPDDADGDVEPDPNFTENQTKQTPKSPKEWTDDTDKPNPQNEDVDVVQQILDEQKLPEKNEIGVISHSEKSFKK